MANKDPNGSQVSSIYESQRVIASHTDMESRSISDENDRNTNVSPSKTSDPARKKTFKIISVKKGGTGSGDLVTDNDADSVDGLDESQTEDLSSEFYDSSKATDLDVDVQDTPLTPDEVTSTTTIVMKQRPDQNSQSRFKVVRIETKDPFRRGKWVCHDFFDSAPAAVVTLNGSKAIEDSIIQSAMPGALSSSTSVHYVHDVNESSSNLFVAPVVPINPSSVPGQPILTDMFFPIQPALSSQVQSNLDGSQNIVTQYPQPIHMSVAGGTASSSSFHNLAQSGVTTIVQSLPHTNVFPYAQNGPSSTFLNGNGTEKTSQPIILPSSTMAAVNGSGQSMPPPMATTPSVLESELAGAGRPAQPFTVKSPGAVAHSQTPIQQQLPHQGMIATEEDSQAVIGGAGGAILGTVGIPVANPEDLKLEPGSLVDQMGPGMDESISSVKTLEPGDTQDPAKLEEAVETMYIGLEGNEEDNDESGGSTVAIDNKIEQAMDLVKRHLMYAVREEVEILKQQIGEMMERIGQLEYENTVLKSEAKPETLSKLLLPRVTQAASQQILPSGGASGGAGGVPTSAGVASQQQQSNVVVAQTQQKPPTPNGQQTTIAMLPPQQAQTISSGTSTPTPQHMQQQQQQQHLHQTSTSQPGQTPMS